MLINEGMLLFLCEMAKRDMDLSEATAGIPGMAFKAESDDKRDSLSYRLKKVLLVECGVVLCSDPCVDDEDLVEQGEVLERADIIFIAAPYRRYRELTIPDRIRVVDIWNCLNPSGSTPTSAHQPQH